MSASQTHLELDARLCGSIVELTAGAATTRFTATPEMRADDRGLVHGGFVFGLADYAAMLAVNDPNVVLGSADVRFVAPVRVGDVVDAIARVVESAGKKRVVEVEALVEGRQVLAGTLTAFVLPRHVLDPAK